MKFVVSNILCKGFVMCRGYITPGDVYNYSPSDAYVDSKFTQIFYMLEGNGTLKCNGEYIGSYDNGVLDIIPEYEEYFSKYLQKGTSLMVDLRIFQGKSFCFEAGSQGATWLCINPIPAVKFFDSSILLPNSATTIIGDGKEHIVICAKGKLSAKQGERSDSEEKIINQFNYVRVLNGKVANFTIPGDSEALYLTR